MATRAILFDQISLQTILYIALGVVTFAMLRNRLTHNAHWVIPSGFIDLTLNKLMLVCWIIYEGILTVYDDFMNQSSR